jgi:hypothetical protein
VGVISPAAGQPPFALDGIVTRDKLIELLAVQTELPELDYKRECNLSTAGGLVGRRPCSTRQRCRRRSPSTCRAA